jgi:hypothetical protein
LDIMKHPHKKEWVWFDWAKGAIEKNSRSSFKVTKNISYIRYPTIISTIHSIRRWGGVCYKMLRDGMRGLTPKMTKMIFKQYQIYHFISGSCGCWRKGNSSSGISISWVYC